LIEINQNVNIAFLVLLSLYIGTENANFTYSILLCQFLFMVFKNTYDVLKGFYLRSPHRQSLFSITNMSRSSKQLITSSLRAFHHCRPCLSPPLPSQIFLTLSTIVGCFLFPSLPLQGRSIIPKQSERNPIFIVIPTHFPPSFPHVFSENPCRF